VYLCCCAVHKIWFVQTTLHTHTHTHTHINRCAAIGDGMIKQPGGSYPPPQGCILCMLLCCLHDKTSIIFCRVPPYTSRHMQHATPAGGYLPTGIRYVIVYVTVLFAQD
jgi:hypothetical protein